MTKLRVKVHSYHHACQVEIDNNINMAQRGYRECEMALQKLNKMQQQIGIKVSLPIVF